MFDAHRVVARYGPRKLLQPLATFVVVGIVAALSAWACDVHFGGLLKGMQVASQRFLLKLFPPDWSAFPEMVVPALVTIGLALIATPLAVVVSFFVALAGTGTIAPRWLRTAARTLMATERALPDTIVALFFVAAFGIGAPAGIVALALGSIGMLGKLFADAMEEVEPAILESLETVGATRTQIIRYAIVPEVLPSIIANSLFRFEINIRNSALLGAVGAGGIGYQLSQAYQLLEYRRMTTAILVTIILVFATERLSEYLRQRVLQKGKLK